MYRQGDPTNGFFFIESGECMLLHRPPAAEGLDSAAVELATMGPGEWFGEAELLRKQVRTPVRGDRAERLSVRSTRRGSAAPAW